MDRDQMFIGRSRHKPVCVMKLPGIIRLMFCVTGPSDGSDPDLTVHWVGDYLIIWSGIHTSRLNDSGRGKSLISSVRACVLPKAEVLYYCSQKV